MDTKNTELENEPVELEEEGEEVQNGLKIRSNLKAGYTYYTTAISTSYSPYSLADSGMSTVRPSGTIRIDGFTSGGLI